ncbi:MAG TPA: hypothetical protein VHL78_06170 [Actinomycetota bacterium]|nr:hypothetical protein [Actinomycetota bacterium]
MPERQDIAARADRAGQAAPAGLRARSILVAVAVAAAWVGAAPAWSAESASADAAAISRARDAAADHPRRDPARGMVYRGLERPDRPQACPRPLYEVRDDRGALRGCSHGPDPAPHGIDVRDPVAADDLPEPPPASPVPCTGDGTSGNRVQAIYGYPAGSTDRYATIAPLIQGWAASHVDDVFSDSAAETGGERHVRFVHDAACNVVVTKFQFSATGDDSFGNTISELVAAGFTSHQRKFLVWMDAPGPYCGIGEVMPDDQPGASNLNNGHPNVDGLVARVDAPCWGLSGTPVETHELAHNMGAVQPSAPHTTSAWPSPAGWHCTDEYDVMCYDDDGPGPVQLDVACPAATDRTLDCNHDDYFSTDPPAGSYLDTHWNVADSSFLTGDGGSDGSVEPPAVAVSIAKKPAGLPFTVTWASSVPTGYVFDVQYKVGAGVWKNWRKDTAALSRVFGKKAKPVKVKAGKTYAFKARWQSATTTGPWSAKASFTP